MLAVMHVVFAAVGALIGANIVSGGWIFGALVGAFIGFAIGEFTLVRRRLLTLEEEVAELRVNLRRREMESAQRPPAQPACDGKNACLRRRRPSRGAPAPPNSANPTFR